MFFKNKIKYNVTKIYFGADKFEPTGLLELVQILLKYSKLKAIDFSLNCSSDREMSNLSASLKEVELNKLENLVVYTDDGDTLLDISNVFSKLELTMPIYRITIISEHSLEFDNEIELFNRVSVMVNLLYGYTRFLNSNYSPESEVKIKKSFWGSSSIAIVNEASQWLVHPKNIENGAVKGFYPLNYLNDKALAVVEEQSCQLIVPEIVNNNILIVDAALRKSLMNNSSLKNYLHFNGS